MEHATGSKLRSRPARQDAGRQDSMTMFLVNGAPLETLSGYDLPAGSRVAVVSSEPEAIRQIEVAGGRRFDKPTAVVVARPATAHRELSGARAITEAAFEPDARSRALLEGVRIAQADLAAAGGAYTLDEVRMLMHGISRQAVDKRVQEGTLLTVPGPSNRRSYPTLQFDRDGSLLPGLKDVRDALPTQNPWAVLSFLAGPDARLGGDKPIDLLRSGAIDRVVEAARRYGEQGA